MGVFVGPVVCDPVAAFVGATVGIEVGSSVGVVVGSLVGDFVGASIGDIVGASVGDIRPHQPVSTASCLRRALQLPWSKHKTTTG